MNLLASFGEIVSYIGYVLIAVLILLFMITVHELGHYISGKILGFKIDEFSIGFGPKIIHKQKKNGEYFSLRLIPLGGFCAFHGEDGENDDPQSFNNKKPWQRIIVLVSGALMNFLSALVIIIVMFFSFGVPSFKITDVYFDDAYNEYSLKAEDIIISANGKTVFLSTDLMNAISGKQRGDLVDFVVQRKGQTENVKVMLRVDTTFNNVEDLRTLFTALGTYSVSADSMYSGMVTTNLKLPFFKTIGRSFSYSACLGGTVFKVLGELLTGKLGVESMGGTITTISVTADAIRTGGAWYLLYISSFIGVNLAVFNLLPIPALDGSRVVFTIIEWIRKKPVNRKIESAIHTVGFVLIFGFAIAVDLLHLI